MSAPSLSTRHSASLWLALGAGALCLAMARFNLLSFPFPSNDEARFYLPALWWAQHSSLAPVNAHAPNGIYWVPDGFTLLIGLLLRAFGASISVARLACELMVCGGVVLYSVAFQKLTGSRWWGALATLLLLSPPVVLAANMVRMEAPLFLLVSLVLLLHLRGFQLAAASLLFASLLLHPACAIAALAYGAVTVWSWRRPAAWEWAAVAVVAFALAAEAWHVGHHLALFHQHMEYQRQRKMSRSLLKAWLSPHGALFLLGCGAVGWSFRASESRQDTTALALAALYVGLVLYAVLGQEMPYNVYSLSLGGALLFALLGRSVAFRPGLPA